MGANSCIKFRKHNTIIAPDKAFFNRDLLIAFFFLISSLKKKKQKKKHILGYSLEAPGRDASNEKLQHMFLLRNKNINLNIEGTHALRYRIYICR